MSWEKKSKWVDDDGSETVGTPFTAERMNNLEELGTDLATANVNLASANAIALSASAGAVGASAAAIAATPKVGSVTFPGTAVGKGVTITKVEAKLWRIEYVAFANRSFPIVTAFGAGIGAIQMRNITASKFDVAVTAEGEGSGFVFHVLGE